ncbi:MAG: response regulator transcription factor [Ruminiclostridium sp.]|nr:response regulator transcription factor [Ruminiclostridium sp.]
MKIAVCDDNSEYMKNTLLPIINLAAKGTETICEITFFTDGNKLISEFEKGNTYDIVMLDIDMPEINGKAVAEKLRVLDSAFFLLFISSYKSEVFNTIPYRINAFIPKDSDSERMLSEISRVITEYKAHSPEYMLFEIVRNKEKSTVKIAVEDIFCFYCVRRTVYLKTGSKTYELTEKRISELIKKFQSRGFFEICRGYCANISKIKCVNSIDIEMDNGEKLPLSRRKAKELMLKISEYVTERTEL